MRAAVLRVSSVLAIAAMSLALAATAGAQSFQGGLRGTVHDPQGVIPGVTVTLINEKNERLARHDDQRRQANTRFPRSIPASTDQSGRSGFKTFERKGVSIGTQQFVDVSTSTIEVGAIEETITVTGESPLIDTTNASTGDVLDKKTLDSLPSVGRSVSCWRTPCRPSQTAATRTGTGCRTRRAARAMSLGGGAVRANNYLVDGFPVTDLRTAPRPTRASKRSKT